MHQELFCELFRNFVAVFLAANNYIEENRKEENGKRCCIDCEWRNGQCDHAV